MILSCLCAVNAHCAKRKHALLSFSITSARIKRWFFVSLPCLQCSAERLDSASRMHICGHSLWSSLSSGGFTSTRDWLNRTGVSAEPLKQKKQTRGHGLETPRTLMAVQPLNWQCFLKKLLECSSHALAWPIVRYGTQNARISTRRAGGGVMFEINWRFAWMWSTAGD